LLGEAYGLPPNLWREMTSHHAMVRAAAVLLVALTLIGTAAAATIRGTARNDRINAVNGVRQTVICGRGVDIVNVELLDLVRADCETVTRRIARDTTRVGGAQHASIAEPDSFSFGSTVVATFQVGRFEDGGAGRIGWASSLDAGRTWRSGLLPGIGRASDPSIAYDAAHRVWLAVTLGISGLVEPTSIDINRRFGRFRTRTRRSTRSGSPATTRRRARGAARATSHTRTYATPEPSASQSPRRRTEG
jgi:hypothetical protein